MDYDMSQSIGRTLLEKEDFLEVSVAQVTPGIIVWIMYNTFPHLASSDACMMHDC